MCKNVKLKVELAKNYTLSLKVIWEFYTKSNEEIRIIDIQYTLRNNFLNGRKWQMNQKQVIFGHKCKTNVDNIIEYTWNCILGLNFPVSSSKSILRVKPLRTLLVFVGNFFLTVQLNETNIGKLSQYETLSKKKF